LVSVAGSNMPDTDRCRVLMFTSQLGTGGAEKHLVRVANHLDRRAFDVTVAVARGGGSYQNELEADVPLHVFDGRMRNALTPFIRLVRRTRPDVIFSVLHHANCVALAATALVPSSPPVVIGIQNTSTIELRQDVNTIKRVIRKAIPLLYPRAAAIVALSSGVRDDLARWLPRLRARTEVIYNAGFDERVLALGEVARSADEPPAAQGPVVIACGRMVPQKGYPHLLDAFARLRARRPATLWIVGDGPLRPELEERTRTLGIAGSVWFAGFRSNPYALMRRADVFVLSSLWEGFGNVIVEAMAVGTPVVATDCPHGPAEIIRGENEGVLVPPGDPVALAAALERVLGDRRLLERMVEGGHARAESFAATRIASQYGELLLRSSHRLSRIKGSA
jgi:glycosyltransferase involved in cell wall biosynthesis